MKMRARRPSLIAFAIQKIDAVPPIGVQDHEIARSRTGRYTHFAEGVPELNDKAQICQARPDETLIVPNLDRYQ